MFKLIVLFLSIQPALCTRSFTIVLDTTVSMRDEISVIKTNIASVVNAVNGSYSNFILVPFKDTVVENPFITESAREFMSYLGLLSTSGGNDCPENSLGGLVAALRASEKPSTIFLFTDAYAKDYINFRAVESLCKETHSQVVIFLSGYCLTGQVGNVEVYYDVAKACSGAVLKFDTTRDLRQAFTFMKEVASTDWNYVTSYEKFTHFKQISFSVDSFTTALMIVVSGSDPSIEVLKSNSQMMRPFKVIGYRQSLVVGLREPEAGDYTANIRGQGPIRATVYERNHVPFVFGFSTRNPRNIKETASRPLPGYTNYILINVASSIKLRSVEWLNFGDSVKQILLLKQIPSGSYVSSVFVEPGKMFQFWIIGEENSTQREIKGSSKLLSPQTPVDERSVSHSKPKAEILDTDLGLIDFGTELTLACKVTGYPKSNISWEDEEGRNTFPSEVMLLEIPSVYISYVTVGNVTKNSTLVCNAVNSVARTYTSIDVYVNRTFTFEVIHQPEDMSVEYGNQYYLNCQVDAYPEATIKWYFNDSLIPYTSARVHIQDNALVIKSMGFEDIGNYECRVSNDVESRVLAAFISISGVEAPEIEETETKIRLKTKDWTEFECKIAKGKPAPEISWQYKSAKSDDFTFLPDGVSSDGGKVKITLVENNHAGIYRCTASNALGEDTKDFDVKIQSPPTIKYGGNGTLVVKEDETVRLECEVEATPEATVRWEMSQDDVIIPFDERHHTDDKHTHRFKALWKDSGNYHCIAENSVGKAEGTIFVNVLVRPYIETPKSELVYANMEGNIDLACNVLYGNPAPSITWQYIAKDSTSRVITRDNSTSTLHLTKVLQSDGGSYRCIAENAIGMDRITYNLIVQ